MPVIIRKLNDKQAVLAMVDSNLHQRETILPSEKAWAYHWRMEVLNHNGIKGEQNSCDTVAEQTGDSATQIFRFIRLTKLIEDLLDMVDARKLAFNPAVELSYLSYEEQRIVFDCIGKHDVKPSLSQAVRLKKLNKGGNLTSELIEKIISEQKRPISSKKAENIRFRDYFPPDYSQKQIDAVIIELLKNWKMRVAT